MAQLQQLVDVADRLEQSKGPPDWQAANAALVPLAALALHAADRIEGLPEVLAAHGWRDSGFDGAVDLHRLKHDLWLLFAAHKERQLLQGIAGVALLPLPSTAASGAVRAVPGPPPPWDRRRSLQSFRAYVQQIADEGDRITAGRLTNDLTHYAQVAIADAHKTGVATDAFKRALVRGGWNQGHHAFLTPPDPRRLLACLSSWA